MTTADRIRAMATSGIFPKEIARKLGVPRSEVIEAMRSGRYAKPNVTAMEENDLSDFLRGVDRRREEFQQAWNEGEAWLEREIKAWWSYWGRADYERDVRGLGDGGMFGRRLVAW